MTHMLGVESEVGQLRQAIVHGPGLELTGLKPSNCDALLFDDVLWVDKAREEHDIFAQVLTTWEPGLGMCGPFVATADGTYIGPEDDAQALLSRAVDAAYGRDRSPNVTLSARQGDAAHILTEEGTTAQLLVDGSRGLGEVAGLLLGSVSANCAEKAQCPVLIMHAPDPSRSGTPLPAPHQQVSCWSAASPEADMRIVVARGGNALLQRGDKPDAGVQLVHVRAAAKALAPIANEHDLLICHGNGPQVGMLVLESASDTTLTHSYPLDDLVAQTQGMIGYWLIQSLRNTGVGKPILSLITQTQVDPADPAFAAPSKFVGPGYSHDQAQKLANQHGWNVAADGERWRQVVASPQPQRVVEQATITGLLDTGAVVICGGGGGAAVTEDSAGQLAGVEAVVDKDYVAAMLGIAVGTDRLLVLTDVPAVMTDFGTLNATPLKNVSLAELAGMSFPAGSMAPKIEGCRRFVAATGHPATIGSLTDAVALLAGTAGTTIADGNQPLATPLQEPHTTRARKSA